MNNYQLLINRLDAFIRKYYTNQLLKGSIIFVAAILALYLVVSIGEYYFYFPSTVRIILDILFIGIALFSLIGWVILPLCKIVKLGKVISHEKAATILGLHFSNVQDKLLNVLQLKNEEKNNLQNATLIAASIQQKTDELTPIPFQKAINFTKNKKYIQYLLPSVLAIIFILFAAPNLFKESAARLIAPNKTFEKPAPFTFIFTNKNTQVAQYDDYEVELKTIGKVAPDKVVIIQNGQEQEMQKKNNATFIFKFQKISKDILFNVQAAGYSSAVQHIHVIMRPVINSFKVLIDYPEYTGKKDEVLDNMGDIVAPQGTQVHWAFTTQYTDDILFSYANNTPFTMAKQGNLFTYATKFMHDTSYAIIIKNNQIAKSDSLHYTASIVPDQFPSIQVQQYNDSITGDYVLFVGNASDDYGISKLALNYSIQKVNNQNKAIGVAKHGSIPMQVDGKLFTQFNHMFDVAGLNLEAGSHLTYYFEVWDNDAVNGSKSSKSSIFTYEKPTLKQLDSIVDKKQTEVSKDLTATTKQNDKLDKQVKQLQEKLLEKTELDWQDKKQLQDIANQQKEMQQQLEKAKDKFQKNNKQSEEVKEHSDAIKEKQEQLNKMMDNMLDKEMKEKLARLEDLMKKLNKDNAFQELQEMQKDNEVMQKDLDRIKELMNQLERDMKMEDLAKQMMEMSKMQEELQKASEMQKKQNPELKQDQDKLNLSFEDVKKQMKEIEELNNKEEQPLDMNDMKKDEQDADDKMQNSSSQLSKGDSKKASKSQKEAKEKQKDLADKLKAAASGESPDQLELDMKATRQLLQNLIRLSFGQEALMNEVKTTPTNNPQYIGNIQTQQKLKEDSKMIADSLFKLSKRIAVLSSTINKEVDGVNRNMETAIDRLEQRYVPDAAVRQQYVMTGVNNLALMLNELLQALIKKKADGEKEPGGKGACKNPGGKKPGGAGGQLSDIISQQQKLGNALSQLMQRGKGKGPGSSPSESGQDGKSGKDGNKGKDGQGGKDGQSGKDGKSGQGGKEGKNGKDGKNGSGSGGTGSGSEGENGMPNAQELAQIAAQQSALRKQLNDINNQLLKEGKSLGGNFEKIQQDMDRNETDLVNKRITQEMAQRQSQILSRLLETKEAMREQDQGDERKSNTGIEKQKNIPASLQEILKTKQSAIDYYKTVPADLKPYYKQMVEQYFGTIK